MARKLCEMSDEELIELAQGLHQAIYITECYSAHDVVLFWQALDELERRGYRVERREELIIRRE